jgi:hypothetical protein
MSDRSYNSYTRLILIMGFLFLGLLGSYTAFFDPYWIWRQQPPWLEVHDGHNRVLDVRLRHAKALQLLSRRPEQVILGSSRVYRGFDTDQGLAKGAYNLGLPRLRIAEADAYVRHLLHFTPMKRMILGLDLLMFDADETFISGFDRDLGDRKYVLGAVPASFFTTLAFNDSRLAMHSKSKNDGAWRRNGFRYSNNRDEASIQKVYDRFQHHRISQKQYDQLDQLFKRLVDNGVDVEVYLSPMSKPHLQHFTDIGDMPAFMQWREKVVAIAAENGLVCHDFSTSSPFSSEDIHDNSTAHWVDASHFQPAVGEWILNQMLVH